MSNGTPRIPLQTLTFPMLRREDPFRAIGAAFTREESLWAVKRVR
jgi:hypothetical protein